MKALVVSVLSLLAAFGGITWWALESSGVGILETQGPSGSLRSTHVWFVEPDGQLWVEAGTPENPWYLDIQENARLSFSSAARSGEYVAKPIPDPSSHDLVRSLLRQKYGARDWWVGLLVDTSRSVAVRLTPAGAERSPER